MSHAGLLLCADCQNCKCIGAKGSVGQGRKSGVVLVFHTALERGSCHLKSSFAFPG